MSECEDNVRGHGVEMPTTEAEGAFEDPFKMPNLAEVRAAHIRLMRAYVSVIATCSSIEQPEGLVVGRILLPFWVRRLVGGHIRRRLMELGTIYLQLGQAVYDERTQSVDPWLSETSKGCIKFAKSLPKWSLPGIAVVTSLALPVVGLLSRIHGSGLALALALGLAVLFWLIVIILLVSFGPVRKAYLRKRELFLPEASKIDGETIQEQEQMPEQELAHNVYWLEDALYETLQRKKKPERQVDRLLFLWAFVITVELTVGLTIHFLPLYWLVADIVFIGIFVSVLAKWLVRNRKWL